MVAEFASGQRRGPTSECEVFFEGQHAITLHRILVKRRADRYTLVAVYEQMLMVLNVTAQLFYKAADDTEKLGHSNPKWLEQAASLMVSIAKRYAAAEIGLDELYAVRDAWMKDHGIPLRMPAVGLRKRPASCSAPLTRARRKTPPSVSTAVAGESTEEEDAGDKESDSGS
jgi:hypothetical protein